MVNWDIDRLNLNPSSKNEELLGFVAMVMQIFKGGSKLTCQASYICTFLSLKVL